MIVAFAGGVGGAKLALGLTRVLPPERLTIAVNVGDDFEHLGLHISPDLDTVMYTLAGIANPETGWGIAGESWSFMDALARLGGETWFRLGDRDLATHVVRTPRLRDGAPLSAVTRDLCRQLGIRHAVVPATDDSARTMILSGAQRIAFQDYFVRQQCAPRADGFAYEGADTAAPSPDLAQALADPALAGLVICPSNPFLSIGPILAIPALREAFAKRRVPAIAMSPIIGGAAVKGPAAKLLAELGEEVSPLAMARYYRGMIDMLLIDEADAALAPAIELLGIRAIAAPILMRTDDDKTRLAETCVALLERR